MKVRELQEILSKYPGDTEICVLEKLRRSGAGELAHIINIRESINQDTNRNLIYIETDYESHLLGGYEREEEYRCQGSEINK